MHAGGGEDRSQRDAPRTRQWDEGKQDGVEPAESSDRPKRRERQKKPKKEREAREAGPARCVSTSHS